MKWLRESGFADQKTGKVQLRNNIGGNYLVSGIVAEEAVFDIME